MVVEEEWGSVHFEIGFVVPFSLLWDGRSETGFGCFLID